MESSQVLRLDIEVGSYLCLVTKHSFLFCRFDIHRGYISKLLLGGYWGVSVRKISRKKILRDKNFVDFFKMMEENFEGFEFLH